MKRISLSLLVPWSVLFLLTACSVYIYSLMEWIFFVTKPSFMSGMPFWHQIGIYLLSALGLSIFPLLIIVILAIANRLFPNKYIAFPFAAIGIAVPSLIAASLILILVDNFTYTVFKFGIVSTDHIPRAIYGFLFLVIWAFCFYRIYLYLQARSKKKYPVKRNQGIIVGIFFSLSVLLTIVSIFTNRTKAITDVQASYRRSLPNIILLGSDGVDATHLSVYGYERDTTPRIKSLSSKALLAQNDFTNGGTTAGSVASILTGKLPTETRVIYPPDILDGEDSYQHLPGILKRLGYRTVDLSVPYFGDAVTLNMQGGFDVANQLSGTDNFVVKTTSFLGGGDSAYFVDAILERISDRLQHIFFIKPMINPYDVVIKPASHANEQKRFDEIITALQSSQTPVFVHVHMLGTHGPRFEIRKQVFSADQKQNQDWMADFYDDAILSFDQYVGQLFDYLSNSDKLKNTVVIVYSDHGRQWTIYHKVPLLFWFPNGEYAGKLQWNTQNIDIAPTILDYLQIPIPAWMDGQSLLNKDIKAPQYIFSASVDSSQIEVLKNGLWVWDSIRKAPPFYQLGYVGLVACDQWFELYVQTPGMLYGKVQDHTDACDSSRQLTPEQGEHILLDHLSQNGYDVSSFPSSISMQEYSQ